MDEETPKPPQCQMTVRDADGAEQRCTNAAIRRVDVCASCSAAAHFDPPALCQVSVRATDGGFVPCPKPAVRRVDDGDGHTVDACMECGAAIDSGNVPVISQ